MKKIHTLHTFGFIRILYQIIFLLALHIGIYAQQLTNNDNYLFGITHGLSSPVRIAIDNNDVIYITDSFQKCIIKYDSTGNLLGKIEPAGSPILIAINNTNQVFFSNNINGNVLKLEKDGNTRIIYSECSYPSAAIFDSDNNLYIIDSKQKKVIVLDTEGNLLRTIGEGVLVFPTGIGYDHKNNRILVAEHGGTPSIEGGLEAKVLVFDLQGTLINSFGEFGSEDGQFSRIQGLAVDKRGRVYAADPYQGKINVFNEGGEYITTIGEFGKEPGQLNSPMDIVIDSQDRLWVTSMNNGSLEVFKIEGEGQNNFGNIGLENSDLLQNYPNPFSGGTWIPFVLSTDETVAINIYNINGAIIRTFTPGLLPKGSYTGQSKALFWDGTGKNGKTVANGIYFYELKLSETRKVRQMIFVK